MIELVKLPHWNAEVGLGSIDSPRLLLHFFFFWSSKLRALMFGKKTRKLLDLFFFFSFFLCIQKSIQSIVSYQTFSSVTGEPGSAKGRSCLPTGELEWRQGGEILFEHATLFREPTSKALKITKVCNQLWSYFILCRELILRLISEAKWCAQIEKLITWPDPNPI